MLPSVPEFDMESFDNRVPADRCKRCWLRHSFCICAHVIQRQCRTEVILLRHWREARKPSNTGRIATLTLPHIQVYDYGAPGTQFDPQVLKRQGAHLLMPPDPNRTMPMVQPVQRIIVPDGTWGQSRRMCRRLDLMALPRISLPPPRTDIVRLRHPPADWAMSTIEAIALALQPIEPPSVSASLLQIFDEFVRASRRQKGLKTP